jgi:hypothetical protein
MARPEMGIPNWVSAVCRRPSDNRSPAPSHSLRQFDCTPRRCVFDPSAHERDERESKGSKDSVTGTPPGRANGENEAYDSKKKKKKKKKIGG